MSLWNRLFGRKDQEAMPAGTDAASPKVTGHPKPTPTPKAVLDEQLYHAAAGGDAIEVQRLLGAGATPDGFKKDGCAALYTAAACDHVGVMADLISHGAAVDAVVKDRNATSLHAAVDKGRVDATRILLKAGANPNFKRQGEWAPLHQATKMGKMEIVRLLLEHGADLEIKANRGQTPFFEAMNNGRVEVANFLLEKGASVNVVCDGMTPLHVAAMAFGGTDALMPQLLKRGAKVDVKDARGSLPIQKAMEMGRKDLVELLIKAGSPQDMQVAVKFPTDSQLNSAAGWMSLPPCEICKSLFEEYTRARSVAEELDFEIRCCEQEGNGFRADSLKHDLKKARDRQQQCRTTLFAHLKQVHAAK